MNDRRREELLDRLRRTSGTLGASIPETVDVEGESVPLREFYFEIAGQEELREADRERVEEVLSYLRRRRLSLVQRLEEGEMTYETGESLVRTVQKLDRAINALESLDDPSFEEQVRREQIRSAQELVDIMREFGPS